MSFAEKIDIYLRSHISLILILSIEEERLTESIRLASERLNRINISWDIGEGFHWVSSVIGSLPNAKDPITALEYIEKSEHQNGIFILKDFHEAWDNPQVKRKLRSVSQRLKYSHKTIIITAPNAKIPQEIQDEIVLLEYPLPDGEELEQELKKILQQPGARVNLTPLGKEKLIQAALGLTASQAYRVFAKAMITDGIIDDRDIELVTEEKKQIIRENEAIEFYSPTENLDDIGGIGVLKEWLRLREKAFSQEAHDYGLPAPKGIALIGIPGTGKSLTAKMIGGLWRLPLLRLDVGALFGSLVGESEERTRHALHLIETIAPCILWIDEMEKALSHGGLDSGTSSRVFGSILTWMQEKTAPVFVVATANDISRLPPELLRKGRFDEIFFLDLPTEEERFEIFQVHINKRNRIPEDFNISKLTAASKGYVGAEIEQSIIDAMYVGFNDHLREFNTDDILGALKRQVPLSVSHKEIIGDLRNWLRQGRAQSASFQEADEATHKFVRIDQNE